MALTCEIMIDDVFVSFENNGKRFNSYREAYFNGLHHGGSKKVYYVFTPTDKLCSKVGDLHAEYKKYFGCDYYDYKNKCMYEQLSFLKGV